MKQQFLKAKTDTIRLTVYESNRPIVPASAKITLYTSNGGDLQAQADATVDSTTGQMTYALTAVHTADHDLNYKAVWEYIYNGTTYYETQLYDVVKCILSIPLTDDDLYDEMESLRKQNVQATGTATAGAASSITDTLKRKESDDYWKGGIVEILSGTGAGQKCNITGSTQSTGVITITPAWATNPDNTSIYRIVKSYTAKIQQCFEELETMLYNKGKRHSLILESSQIKYPLLYLTLHKICQDISDDIDDKWDRLAGKYDEKYKSAFTTMKVEYDEDESGSIVGDDEEAQGISGLRISRS